MPLQVVEWLGIPVSENDDDHTVAGTIFDLKSTLDPVTAAERNDNGWTFEQIAKWLRENRDTLVAVRR